MCKECYVNKNRITPLLNPLDCLEKHTQYICGTCGRYICIERDPHRGLQRWNFPFKSLEIAKLYLRTADYTLKKSCGIYEMENIKGLWNSNPGTDEIGRMRNFYNQVLGFRIINDLGNYVEFGNGGVRFAICLRDVMHGYCGEYNKKAVGQAFELAFPCENPEDVDKSFKQLIAMGATPINEPQDMPWNQKTALFADPDGNIHEIFAGME